MATAAAQGLSPEEQEALRASIFQRLHPRAYLERFLAEGFRPDGRALDGWRDVSVNVGECANVLSAEGEIPDSLPFTFIQVQYQRLMAQHSLESGIQQSCVESKLKLQNLSWMRVQKGF